MSSLEPTALDHANAATRAAIAARPNEAYDEAKSLAGAGLGPGYTPWMNLNLIDSDHHRTGDTRAVATAFQVCSGDERLSENSVSRQRIADGQRPALLPDPFVRPAPTNGVEGRGKASLLDPGRARRRRKDTIGRAAARVGLVSVPPLGGA